MASNYHLIAKNSFLLYVRLLIAVFFCLFTSRIVLHALGVRGFGLYSVVGGLVILLSFLQDSMAGTTQRFLNYEMGSGNALSQKIVFASCLVVHRLLSLLLVIVGETLGLWFLNNMMNINADELLTANIVYQLSLFTFVASILNTPYRSAIMAHERMDMIAGISIMDAVLKLFIALSLYYAPSEKIICYAASLFVLNLFILIAYKCLCLRMYPVYKIDNVKYTWDCVKKILSFSSWVVIGSLTTVGHTQGIAIIINLFFGLTVNAGLGVANQVMSVVRQFVTSFMTALNPQIVKNYALHEHHVTKNLVCVGCKMGAFLVAAIALPILLETPMMIKLWLVEVPPYAVLFIRLNMIVILISSISSPLISAQGATGDIRKYQLVITSIGLLHIPLTLIAFKIGYEVSAAFNIYIILTLLMQISRIWIVCESIGMSKMSFIRNVVIRSTFMIVVASILPVVIHIKMESSMLTSLAVILSCLIGLVLSFYLISLKSSERIYVSSIIKPYFMKIRIMK